MGHELLTAVAIERHAWVHEQRTAWFLTLSNRMFGDLHDREPFVLVDACDLAFETSIFGEEALFLLEPRA